MDSEKQCPLWTIREAAEFLRTTPAAVYKMVERRRIPHARLGGRKLRFDPVVLREWVRQNAVKVA